MVDQAIEPGAAGIIIELRDGRVTVRHIEGGALLASSPNPVARGTWDALWRALDALGIEKVRTY